MKEYKQLLGARIRELRKKRGLTQSKLAEKIGIDPKHLSKIEVGSSYPSLYNLEKISKILNVRLQELFNFEHFEERETLLKEINQLVDSADYINLKMIYRVLTDILL